MAFIKHTSLVLILCILRVFEVTACTGCIQLDEYTFDKMLSKFDVALVKFDVAFPYGDQHEAYGKIAKYAKSHNDLLIAEVGVKDYGERDNEALAQRYGVKKDDFPMVKLFVKNKKEPITFSEKPYSYPNLRKFLKKTAGIILSFPGCVPSLDKLALEFANNPSKREVLLKDAGIIVQGLDSKEKSTGKIYQLIMNKIVEKGDEFIESESKRMQKLLEGQISEDKKKEIGTKLNILKSFSSLEKDNDEKDEL